VVAGVFGFTAANGAAKRGKRVPHFGGVPTAGPMRFLAAGLFHQ